MKELPQQRHRAGSVLVEVAAVAYVPIIDIGSLRHGSAFVCAVPPSCGVVGVVDKQTLTSVNIKAKFHNVK